MLVLITYDVNTQTEAGRRRLRKVAKQCVNYGVNYWVQLFSPYDAIEPEQKPTGTNEKTYRIGILKKYLVLEMKDTEETMTLNIGEQGKRDIWNIYIIRYCLIIQFSSYSCMS